ncbi:MAG: glycosyl hydrolase [bacterium]|nr:glycosyl hydrolase [bacterium]
MKNIIAVLMVLFFLSPLSGLMSKGKQGTKGELNAGTAAGLKFRNIGPALMSGRISDIAVHPQKQSTWYVAAGSGGVWKTVNAGTTWTPIFDKQTSYSIGCVTLDPNNPEVVWVGTGENVSGRHVGYGDGIYKSLNGGKTWQNMGLKQSEHISKILVDPRDSNLVYVAAEGPLWSPGGERGLYKTTDGGKTWKFSLEISKNTGVTDVAMDSANPDILYAAAYQRRRSVASLLAGGPGSGIYKTSDAGKNWRKLTVGLPKGHMGKIALAVSPQKTNVVYATIEAGEKEKGFYRSANRGESWEKRNKYISGGTGPHYYQEIYADPHHFDRVIQMDVRMNVTNDGGKTFQRLGEKYKHSDNHALAFDPGDPDYLLAGSDGGLYETWDRGKTWKFIANLPLTQFYKMSLDNALPFYNVHGGAQDNSSQLGPSRTLNENGIMNSDWFITSGADGYASAVDPKDPNIIYCEWQVGRLQRYDKKSGELVNIQPQPQPGEDPPRWNWDSPLIISPHSHTRLYFGSQRLYRSEDRGDSWTPVSPDLSRGIFRYEQEIMGKLWSVDALWDHGAMSYYGNLTSVSESPLKEGLIYVGTDDGLVQVTEDGGKNWRKIEKFPGVPAFSFVNDIQASEHDADTVFVVFDNHKRGDFKPYLLKSINRGRTWVSVAGDLPDRHILWSFAQDHKKTGLLFTGTEFGIFFTPDGGNQWIKLQGGVPPIAFRDIGIQKRENDLVGATFGRGFFILDDYSPLRHMSGEKLKKEAVLFPIKKTLMYIPRRPLGSKGKADQGHAFFTAPNPPFGAVFTYYLKEPLKTRKQQRRDREKKLEKQGKAVSFPGWDALRVEKEEEKPAVILTVKDRDGQVVRRVTGPVGKGIHRTAWDLRYPSLAPVKLTEGDLPPWKRRRRGPLVVPGTFTVSIAKRVDGVLTSLGEPQTFVVESLGLASLPAGDREKLLAFQAKAGELQRAMKGASAVIKDALKRLEFIEKALLSTTEADPRLTEEAYSLEKRLRDIRLKLDGDRTAWRRGKATLPSLSRRVNAQLTSTTAITVTTKHDYEIAADAFSVLLEKLRQLIETDLKKLEKKMEAAGAPWTPGRGVPIWKKK